MSIVHIPIKLGGSPNMKLKVSVQYIIVIQAEVY